jgi:hypothetical protein
VRGKWEPIITTEEYHRGVAILHKHDGEKSRERVVSYLLRGLLHVRVEGKLFKMHGSTPTGRSHSYSYYITHAKPLGKKLHIPCDLVDRQIPAWLQGIAVEPTLIPAIRSVYEAEVKKAATHDHDAKVNELHRQLSQLKEEEARLGRLFITGKIGEGSYNQLRAEWQEKLRNLELNLADLERDASIHLDDLDAALALMAKMGVLYPRLDEKHRSTLLQILAKRIIVAPDGEIVDYELNSPFVYLRSIVDEISTPGTGEDGSEQVREGAL